MKFLILDTTDPHLNLAIEEYLFLNESDDVFMLWQNAPTVVIGKNQNAYAEIDIDFVKENGVKIARRITGGGAVYHDLGNLNYTFISSSSEKDSLDFEYFTAPIIAALAELGIKAYLSGRNDLMVDEKKFSGNAQHRSRGRTLHHGTLLFDSDLEALTSALRVDPQKIASKAIKSTRSRVTNLRPLVNCECGIREFTNLIAEYVKRAYSPTLITAPECEAVEVLYKRNASEEWLFPERGLQANYSILKKQRYPFGIVEIYLNMANDKIKDVRIQGDFFGVRPIDELEQLLCNTHLGELKQKMSGVDMSDYIFGMTPELFAEQILSK